MHIFKSVERLCCFYLVTTELSHLDADTIGYNFDLKKNTINFMVYYDANKSTYRYSTKSILV